MQQKGPGVGPRRGGARVGHEEEHGELEEEYAWQGEEQSAGAAGAAAAGAFGTHGVELGLRVARQVKG